MADSKFCLNFIDIWLIFDFLLAHNTLNLQLYKVSIMPNDSNKPQPQCRLSLLLWKRINVKSTRAWVDGGCEEVERRVECRRCEDFACWTTWRTRCRRVIWRRENRPWCSSHSWDRRAYLAVDPWQPPAMTSLWRHSQVLSLLDFYHCVCPFCLL